MKLTRVMLEQIRQFRTPLEIDHLEAGLNIFTGPNESGKSTIARAIRAAFFERYRTKSVDDLIPWGDSGAAPHVELDFEIDGTLHALRKTFIKSARCDLRVGARSLDGEDAEYHLSALLGYQFAGRGESKPEHWGIPGLLWIEQGTGQRVHDAVGHAVDHLRSALQGALGEVAGSGGDTILERIHSERDALITANGKPRGVLAESLKRRDALVIEIDLLDQRIDQYRRQVDRLEGLLAGHAQEEAARPWEAHRVLQKQAEEARERLRAVEEALSEDRHRLSRARGTLKLLQESLAAREAREQDLKQRRSAWSELEQRLREVDTQVGQLGARRGHALDALQRARETARRARDAAERGQLFGQIAELKAKMDALESRIAACGELSRQIADLRVMLAGLQVDPNVLAALRDQARALRENAIRQEAAATRLAFELLPGASLTLNGAPVEGRTEHRIIKAAEIGIPGVGHIRVIPGGGDLDALALTQGELEVMIEGGLKRLGVHTLDEAEDRLFRQQQVQSRLKEHERDLGGLAPQGIDGLRASLDDGLARLRGLEDALGRLPELPLEDAVLTMDEADRRVERALTEHDEAGSRMQQAAILNASTQAELEAAGKEIQRLEGVLSDPDEAKRLQDANARLVETKAEIEVLAAHIESQQAVLAQARPDILDQDITRYGRSADNALRQHEAGKLDIARLQAQLHEAGAQGLEEQRGELSVRLDQEERRVLELERRAKALDLLKNMMEARRHELTRKLQAPLQKHLNNYLQLLFPGASIEIDDDLSPGTLQRGGANSAFDELSFGAQEQMGLISRLAYADLLREAGKPTLILLDDVLVHSDAGRLQAMKRVITDAATRHQILLFTCHPEDWGDMGVELRSLEPMDGAMSWT